MQSEENTHKLTIGQYLSHLSKVGKRAFEISPIAAIVKLVDSIIQALLPIVTTYFAALTTTALTQAYGGEEGAANSALLYVTITATLGILSLLWGGISGYITQKTSYLIRAAVEDELLLQFTSLPFHLYDDKDAVDLHDKAEKFSRSFSYIFTIIGSILSATLGAVGSIVALILVSPWLSLIVFLAALPSVFIHAKLARDQMEHWDSNITTRRRRFMIFHHLNTTSSIADIRTYGATKKLLNQHTQLRNKDEGARLKIELDTTKKRVVADTVEAIVQLGSLVWVTLQIISRDQPVGQFLYVQQLVSRAFNQLGLLATQVGQIDEDLAHMVDYQNFMEIEPEEDSGKNLTKSPEKIELKNISFTYPKTDKQVLDEVSIEINRGERIAIVGENGAGKSTLIKILMGLYRPTKGQVLVNNRDLQEYSLKSWHKMNSLLMQEFSIFNFATIKENIALGNPNKKADNESINQAIREAELTDVIKGLKYGTDTFVSRHVTHDNNSDTSTELSGGQRQRLALARNFFRDSPIIVLDEPTSAIDALAESRIFKRLFSRRDKTIIAVSHRLTTIEKADRIYVIKGGRVVESGKHKDLVKSKGDYYTMFESQLREEASQVK